MSGNRVVVLVTAAAFVLAGCGGGGATSSDASAGGGASGAASAAGASSASSDVGSAATIGDVTVTPDSASAVEQLIGPDGGTIEAKAPDGTTFTLTVPIGALPSETTIRATPAALGGLDFPTYTVLFEPTGTEFTDWATLAIVPPAEVPVENQFLYQLNDDATQFASAWTDPKATAPTILLDHFSGYGLANATDPQVAAVLTKGADAAEARIQSEMAGALGKERQGQLLGDENAAGALESFDKYSKQYEDEVIKPLLDAAGASCEATQRAISTVLGYERQRQLIGYEGASNIDGMQVLTDALNAEGGPCEKEAITKCKAAKDPGILLRYWLGVARQRALLGMEDGLDMKSMIKKARSICAPKSYDAHGDVPSVPSGITIDGLICSLSEPFTLKLAGDYIGRMKFTPSSDEAGSWSFKGRVGNAPFTADGSGSYTVAYSEDGLATSIDFDFESTIHIPMVGDQSGGGKASITLAPIEGCAVQQ